jgi:hypothetical protein
VRRAIVLVFLAFLFVTGCGRSSKPDTDAARAFVRRYYSSSHISFEFDLVEGPEYATIPRIPRDLIESGYPDKPADGGVRVRFTWREENRTTHDDVIVWLSSDHKAVGWSRNPRGDRWRQFVQSIAKK